jgi:PAS domain S-box-containing protein
VSTAPLLASRPRGARRAPATHLGTREETDGRGSWGALEEALASGLHRRRSIVSLDFPIRHVPEGESREVLEQALDRIADGFVVCDRAWRILYLNHCAETYFVRTRRGLLGRSMWEALPGGAGSPLAARMRGAAEGAEPSELEALAPARDRWTAFRVLPSETRICIAFRDVTDQRTTREALRASEARLRAGFRNAPDAMILGSPEGEVLAANDAACRMFDRTEGEMRAAGRNGLIDASDPAALAMMGPGHDSGLARLEIMCVRKNGATFPAEISSTLYTDAEGRRRTSLTVRDLTEHKRDAEHLDLIIAAGGVLGSRLDSTKTLHDLTELLVPRFADFAFVEVIERGGLRRVAASHRDRDRDRAIALASVDEVATIPTRERGVFRVARTGEAELVEEVDDDWIRASVRDEAHLAMASALGARSAIVVPIVARGTVLGVLGLFTTSNEQRYTRADLSTARAIADRAAFAFENARLHEQTLQAMRLRNEVLNVVSHDLRNPLNTIRIGARLLGSRGDRSVEMIEHAVTFADALIRDLLTVATIEAGVLPLEPETYALREIVRAAVDLYQALADERSIELASEIDDPLPHVRVDKRRIVQVVGNLLGNAIKFTPEGGRIQLSVRAGEAGEAGEGCVVVSVSDTGPGIAPEALPHVFDRFWQSAHARRAGVGLGLAIAKGIVEAHGGEIRVAAVPGGGATFSFTLPHASETALGASSDWLTPGCSAGAAR